MNERLDVLQSEPATTRKEWKETEVGSVFVSNYPPYSFWSKDTIPAVQGVLNAPPQPDTTLGLYLHIPFCRKRCKFCYFRVYTDKNSDEIQTYLDAISKEVELYSEMAAVRDRGLKFVYFGGGTPSFISAKQLKSLASRIKAAIPWKGAEEIAFECEPGTLTRSKIDAIKDIGVTRLSLGIENFDDGILQANGRAHLSKEIYESMPWIRAAGFDQVNIDLIAGMLGESWKTWEDSVQKTVDLEPDSVTIYQMELPFNTVFSKERTDATLDKKISDWQVKREWHDYAFEKLAAAGYEISSAYTMTKEGRPSQFVYRDSVWHGTDMVGAGISSFSHMSGVHFQNVSKWDDYIQQLENDQLPIERGFETDAHERLTREMILQLKLGRLPIRYFKDKFDTNILHEFADAYAKLENEGMLEFDDEAVHLTRKGLLRIDQLLPEFYAPQYQNSRYT